MKQEIKLKGVALLPFRKEEIFEKKSKIFISSETAKHPAIVNRNTSNYKVLFPYHCTIVM
jgi:hypothetical protein